MDDGDEAELVRIEVLATFEDGRPELPPVLLGRATPAVAAQVQDFYNAVAEIFERWVTRRSSPHTRRAYRRDVMAFCEYLGLHWPEDATRLLAVTVADVLAFRDLMVAEDKAPKTINRRVASLSSFYKYLQGAASELRLPITVPNPAHAQFIARGATDPRDERRALSATRARQLVGLPAGDSVLDYRDRAILKFFLYTRGPHRHRLPAEGRRLPPGRRRGDDRAAREGRPAAEDRPALRRRPGDRRVRREGGPDEGAVVPGPPALAQGPS